LDELGFVWDQMEADLEEGLSHLRSYKDREGHCRVPTKHEENGFRLGQWVSNRRANRSTLSDKKRRQLDALGFVWKVR
jgi:Helicase associated domain